MGDGSSIITPFTFAEALASIKIKPGHTLWLRGGTYTGDFVSDLVGESNNLIYIRPYQNEHPVIDGSLIIGGGYTFWQNIEVTYSGWSSRETAESGSSPSDMPHTKKFEVTGDGVICDGLIIHDMVQGSCFADAENVKFNGCLIYNNGWKGPDRGHGHGLYIQNGVATKTIKDCVFPGGFGWGIHAYTEGGTIDYITVDRCIGFRAGNLMGQHYNDILIGGLAVAHHIVVQNCFSENGSINIGYDAGADIVSLLNNRFPGGVTKINVTNLTETGNDYTAALGNEAYIDPNEYQPDRANVTIYNQAEENTVLVNLSGVHGLAIGDTVNVRNVQDYFTDIQTLVIDAGFNITIDVQAANRTVAAPVEWDAPDTTFPTFGCFVVEKV
jgi:hypothetical protein